MVKANAAVAERLVAFLSGAASDSWECRRTRLLALQNGRRPGVALHAKRVARNARLLALDIGMTEAAAGGIHEAAVLHDMGKLAVSENVLYKNGPLDQDERREIHMHAAYGFGLLDVVGAPEVVLDVVKYHHERYGDGRGYFGVAGENIPYSARIVAIADVHEALTAKREYKSSMSEGDALSMMIAITEAPALGRAAFDPFLLRRFVAMRLRDPLIEVTVEQKTRIEEFARSDPMEDVGQRRDLKISRAGHRIHYSVDAAGRRELTAMTRPDGSRMTGFPRLTPTAEPLAAPSL